MDRGLWSRERTAFYALEYCQGHCADFRRCDLGGRRKLSPGRLDRVLLVSLISAVALHPGDHVLASEAKLGGRQAQFRVSIAAMQIRISP